MKETHGNGSVHEKHTAMAEKKAAGTVDLPLPDCNGQ